MPSVGGRASRRAIASLKRSKAENSDFANFGYFFIELFSGAEEWSRALRIQGMKAYCFDILQGPEGDLLCPPVRRRVMTMIKSGMRLGVLAGVVCTSFSRARGGGPKAIRSSEVPMGLPGLSEKNQGKVSLGNQLLEVSYAFFRQRRRFKVPFSWENDLTSIQWWTTMARHVAPWPQTQDITVHHCAYGTRWKKPTKLRCFHLEGAERLRATCHGKRLCQYNGKPHIILQGRDEHNMNWTLRAQPYVPRSPCTQDG